MLLLLKSSHQRKLCYGEMIGMSPCEEIKAGAELLSLLFEKCSCISKAVVIKILWFLFFSKSNSDDNVSKRLRA